MNPHRTLSVVMVTYDSAGDILRALGSLRLQSLPVSELVVVDNASRDAGLELVRRHWPGATLIANSENRGFAAAANQGIRAARHDLVLLMNPDVECHAGCVEALLRAAERHPDAAVICGKLLRFEEKDGLPVIDSAGMVMTPDLRHLDRGAGETDRGQYERSVGVFGASGALMLARRSYLERVAVAGQIFDERFHSYREDADLAWRLRLAGMDCVYTPQAVARHRRRVTPERRRELPDFINRNGVRNRVLMRINNLTPEVWAKTALRTGLRDLLVLGACLSIERSSFPGLVEALRDPAQALRRRREVMKLRRPGVNLSRWFDGCYVENLEDKT